MKIHLLEGVKKTKKTSRKSDTYQLNSAEKIKLLPKPFQTPKNSPIIPVSIRPIG
jgi:hypothetical protein